MRSLQVVRIGAFGDHLIWGATLPFLQKLHGPISLEVNMKGLELFLNDSRFDRVSVFDPSDTDEADRYKSCMERWTKLQDDCKKSGARYLNFWSSIENSCVLHEFNPDVLLTKEERAAKYCGNFYEKTFELAELQIPDGWFHENTIQYREDEISLVERWREKNKDSFVMMVALAGSSRNKVFPTWIQTYCKGLIDQYPKLRIYLMGGSDCSKDTWEYERTFSYVNGASPQHVPFRLASIMTSRADYVLGADTGLMIAAGMFGTPKTVLFTMVEKSQIVKYHQNDYSVQSMAECSPCRIMAYSGSCCPTEKVYNSFPICTDSFDLDELHNIFDSLYAKKF